MSQSSPKTFTCIAGGPSLTKEDADFASARTFTIGVNDAYRITRLDVLYASDFPWWQHHWEHVKDLECRKITGKQKIAGKGGDISDQIERWEAENKANWRSPILNFGRNSGFAAIHVAILMGAERVLLLGYDMQVKGKYHWFGDHPKELRNTNNYHNWVSVYAEAQRPPGVEIINCSRETALTCFPRMSIEEALCNQDSCATA